VFFKPKRNVGVPFHKQNRMLLGCTHAWHNDFRCVVTSPCKRELDFYASLHAISADVWAIPRCFLPQKRVHWNSSRMRFVYCT